MSFFFQAEDGIRDSSVTGVQTCALPILHLRPSGHTGTHFVAQHVVREFGTKLFYELGPLRARANDAHVAEEDVEELGELVEGPGTNPASHPRSPRILRLRPLRAAFFLGPLPHRSELDDVDRLAVESHPHLAIEDLTAIFEPD